MTANPIDYVGLAAELLERAAVLVPKWLPAGVRVKHLWHVGDFDGSEGRSANVNLKTGAWGDNGRPGDSGRDLISLYGRIHGLSNHKAALDLMDDVGWRQLQAPAPVATKRQPPKWTPVAPVPADAPPYRTQWAHYARGVPHAHWEYRNQAGQLLGVVSRFNTSDGGKEVQPLSWCHGPNGARQWRYLAFGQPRPLYGLWRLPAGHRGLVVVTEGERKADLLHQALGGDTPVLSWPGGCKAVGLADWTALSGCQALLWPDADAQRDKATQAILPREQQPGWAAMRKVAKLLAALDVPADLVDIGEPGSRPDAWDAADAVAEGWTRQQLLDLMAQRVPGLEQPAALPPTPPAPPAPADAGAPPPPPAARADGDDGDDADPRWRDQYVTARGQVVPHHANVSLVLANHPLWQGVLGYDAFSQRVTKRAPAPYDADDWQGSEWTDIDDTRASAWIARREGWLPSSAMVAEAVAEVADQSRFHPVVDWLQGLQHDGVARIDHWLADLLGVVDSDYVRLVSRYYLVGMCMRVLHPGCKFDYCLVLEGKQGRGKSTALSILGGEWYSDTELDLGHKDAMSNIRGKWLHEFSEMGALARQESTRQKSFLSRQVDEFRPAYARREIRCPRQSAFAGSTNEWAWNKDPTGGRRFWPVEVGEINTDGLRAVRDQLFAEAFAAARAGERYWPTPDEQREIFDPEQLSRETPDALVEMLADWLAAPSNQHVEFTLADAAIEGLKLDAARLTRDIQTRIGTALRKLDCERVERRTAAVRFVYKRPARKGASSQPAQLQQQPGAGEEVPF